MAIWLRVKENKIKVKETQISINITRQFGPDLLIKKKIR
jgi:hypothetical protein